MLNLLNRLSEYLASLAVEDDRLTFFGWISAAIVAMAILASITNIVKDIVG